MCGGGDVNYPAPDPKQVELQQAQLDLLNKQSTELEAFKPMLMEQFGYQYGDGSLSPTSVSNKQKLLTQYQDTLKNIAKDPTDNQEWKKAQTDWYTQQINDISNELKVTKTPAQLAADAASQDFQTKAMGVAKLQLDRQQQALEGKLPVSSALVQAKGNEFAALKEQLGQGGDLIVGDDPNTAMAKSTSGQQALEMFKQRYGVLEDNERRGIIEGGSGLANTYAGGAQASQAGMMRGVPNQSYYGMMPMYNQALQPYQMAQQGRFQSDMFNSQQQTAKMTGMMQLAGQLGGSAMGAMGMSAMSSKAFKKDITRLSVEEEDALFNQLMSTPINRYHYKDEDDLVPRHVGFITEEAPPEVVTEDGKHLSIVDYFGVMTLALKVMNRKIDSIAQRQAA